MDEVHLATQAGGLAARNVAIVPNKAQLIPIEMFQDLYFCMNLRGAIPIKIIELFKGTGLEVDEMQSLFDLGPFGIVFPQHPV